MVPVRSIRPFLFSSPPRLPPFRPFTTHPPRYASSPPPPLPPRFRFRWAYLWHANLLALGVALGLAVRRFAGPIDLPAPGSREDERMVESLARDIDGLDIVTSLRNQSHNRHPAASLASSSSHPDQSGREEAAGGDGEPSAHQGWLELDWRLGGQDKGEEAGILAAMSGVRGVGVQRAFWNPRTRDMVAVVWIGGGLSGWPGIVHGGAIATLLEEVMMRMSRGPQGRVGSEHRPNTISITYAKPTYAMDFYVLRASFSPSNPPSPEPQAEAGRSWSSWWTATKATSQTQGMAGRQEIISTLETIKGEVCVRAKGTVG